MADHLETELRRTKSISDLLDDSAWDDYIPASKLKLWRGAYNLSDVAVVALSAKFPTGKAWKQAKAETVHQVLDAFGLDFDDAANLLRKIKRGLGD